MAGVTKITCFGVHGLSGDRQQASTLSDNSRNPGSCDSWPRSIVEALSNRLWTSPGYRSSQVWWEAVNPHGVDRKEPQPCGISSHPEITSSTRQLIGVIAGFLKTIPAPEPPPCTFSKHGQLGCPQVCSPGTPETGLLRPSSCIQRDLSRDLPPNGSASSILPALQSLCHRGRSDQAGHLQGSTGGRNQLITLVYRPPSLNLSQFLFLLPPRMKKTKRDRRRFWTFPLTGNHLFVFKVP